MKTPLKACGTALAVAALGLALAGCGSDSKTEATSSSSSSASSSSKSTKTSEAKPSKTEAPAGTNKTIADYVKDGGLTETPVKRGDPGSPTIDLPFPAGWEDAGPNAPEWAYGAIVNTDPAFASDPPTIIAIVSKLTGPVDPAKILEFAPGELKNLPGFDAMGGNGEASTLGGFDAFQFGGTYVKDGAKRMIAQKTVVIPAKDGDGVFVLQLNADGTEDQMGPLMDATTEIDEKTTITP
jgi:hypothetical protein